MRNSSMWFLTLSTVLALVGDAHAGEDYFLLMFGSQRIPNNPNYAHTFATFVKACSADGGTLEAHTISWLPAKLVVRTLALRPECGRNFDLPTTIQRALDNCERVSLWGPYKIDCGLYQRALDRIAELESGQVLYKADDTGRRSDRVSNCIHAVSTVTDGARIRVASPGWGEPASYFLVTKFRPWIVDPDCIHPWVSQALGLDDYPIVYRDPRERPRSTAIYGPIYRLFGGEAGLEATYGRP